MAAKTEIGGVCFILDALTGSVVSGLSQLPSCVLTGQHRPSWVSANGRPRQGDWPRILCPESSSLHYHSPCSCRLLRMSPTICTQPCRLQNLTAYHLIEGSLMRLYRAKLHCRPCHSTHSTFPLYPFAYHLRDTASPQRGSSSIMCECSTFHVTLAMMLCLLS